MAREIFSEIDVAVVCSPVTLSHGLTTEGAGGSMQQYDIAAGTWLPDWTKAWVVVRPWLNITDPDGLLPSGAAQWTNPHWYLSEDGVETEIVSGTDFTVHSSGEDAGVLVVKRNTRAGSPMTLRFEGEFVDAVRGDVRKVVMTLPLVCESVSTPPVLTLDQAPTVLYDPIRSASDSVTLHALLKVGESEVDAAKRLFVWEMKRPDGTWTEAGTEVTDEDVEVSADGTEATVRLDLMGRRLDLRCRARFDPYGNPASVALEADSPTAYVTFIRRLRKVWPVGLMPRRIHSWQKSIKAEAVVNDGVGVVENAEAIFRISWHTATGQSNGSLNYGPTPVAVGAKVDIPTDAISRAYGGKVRVGLSDRGPLKYLTVDGKVLTVGGKKLMAKAF